MNSTPPAPAMMPPIVQAVPQYVVMPNAAPQRNGLGLLGFLLTFVGLFIPTGIVSVLGLMLSLVAVGRSPRGLAAVGVVLGLLGTLFWLVVSVAVVLAGLVAAVGAVFSAGAFALVQPEVVEVTSDMVNVTLATREHQQTHGTMPKGLAELNLGVAAVTDPWGNGYQLVEADDDLGFEVISAGQDGTFDTADDIALSRLDRYWEQALEDFEDKMDELGDRLESMGDGAYAMGCEDRVVRIRADRFAAPGSFYRSVAIDELARETAGR